MQYYIISLNKILRLVKIICVCMLVSIQATSLFASLAFVVLKYWLIIFSARNCDLVYDGWI